jgi:hypothetical protein
MHGDKRWIRDYTGRLKKSSDKTRKDWLGDCNRCYTVRILEIKSCSDCQDIQKDLDRYYWGQVRCSYHQWKHDISFRNDYSGRTAPKWVRKVISGKFRTRVRNIIQLAKYDYEKYDDIPPEKLDAAWDYW